MAPLYLSIQTADIQGQRLDFYLAIQPSCHALSFNLSLLAALGFLSSACGYKTFVINNLDIYVECDICFQASFRGCQQGAYVSNEAWDCLCVHLGLVYCLLSHSHITFLLHLCSHTALIHSHNYISGLKLRSLIFSNWILNSSQIRCISLQRNSDSGLDGIWKWIWGETGK